MQSQGNNIPDYKDDVRTGLSFINRNAVVDAYFNEIRKFTPLSDIEIRKLVKTYRMGKTQKLRQDAMDKIVMSNQRLVVIIAKAWLRGDNLLDLVNEGNIGLIEAVKHFNTNKSTKFISYAVLWVKSYIRNYVAECEKLVKPANASRLMTYTMPIRSSFFNTYGRYPTNEELASIINAKYNYKVTDLNDLNIIQKYNIDISDEEETVQPLENTFTKELSVNDIEDGYDKEGLLFELKQKLKCLTERERAILLRYNGVGCYYPLTFIELASEYGITPEMVRVLYKRAIEKCRKI